MKRALFAGLLLCAAQFPSLAQQGAPANTDLGALPKLNYPNGTTGLQAGTVNSDPIPNQGDKGVMCTFNPTSSTGSNTTVFSIQAYDAASATWQSLVSSGSLSPPTAATIAVYPGMATASLPSGWTAASIHLPALWRVQHVLTGSNVWLNYTIGCNTLN